MANALQADDLSGGISDVLSVVGQQCFVPDFRQALNCSETFVNVRRR
jgi:hypothetical protein